MFFVRLYVCSLSRSLTYSIDQSFILMMMRSLVGNDIESKRWEFTLSQNHFRPLFLHCHDHFFHSLFSTNATRASFHSYTNYADARTHACLHRILIFLLPWEKKKHRGRLEENFSPFFIFFRSAVCLLEFLIFFSSATTTYYYHKRRQLLRYIYMYTLPSSLLLGDTRDVWELYRQRNW